MVNRHIAQRSHSKFCVDDHRARQHHQLRPSISNTALIGTSALESTYADNTASAPAISVLCANVAITKTANVSQVLRREQHHLHDHVQQQHRSGAQRAHHRRVTRRHGLRQRHQWSRPPPSRAVKSCGRSASLAPGDLRSFILTVGVPASNANCRTLDPNNVSISTTTIETTCADNTASTARVDVICADWAMVKTADRPSGAPNDPIDYTITYTNRSDYLLSGAIITDVLPANTIYVTDTSGLPLINSGGILTWTLPPLPPTGLSPLSCACLTSVRATTSR